MAVSEVNDMRHDVFFPRSDRGIKAYEHHEGSGTKLELGRVILEISNVRRTCSVQPQNFFEEQHFRYVFFTFCSGTDRRNDGQGCDCGPPKLTRHWLKSLAKQSSTVSNHNVHSTW